MNTIRAKIVKTNKVQLPVSRSFFLLMFIVGCSFVPSLYSFEYLAVWLPIAFEYIWSAVFSIPGVIVGGILGNLAYDLLKKKYGKLVNL